MNETKPGNQAEIVIKLNRRRFRIAFRIFNLAVAFLCIGLGVWLTFADGPIDLLLGILGGALIGAFLGTTGKGQEDKPPA